MRVAVADTEADELTAEQAAEQLDVAARHYLDISGEQFKDAWRSGALDREEPGVMRVAMLLPGA
jgi:hypothetical protein